MPLVNRRFLEIATGIASVLLLTLPLWGSILFPTPTAWLIFLFCLYWLYNGFRFSLNAFIGYVRMHRASGRNWLSEAETLNGFDALWHLVIVPTYREPAEVLAATLDHLVAQDFPRDRMAVVLAFEARDRGASAHWQALQARYADRFGFFWCTFHPDIEGEVKGKSSNEAWAARWAAERLIQTQGIALDRVVVTTSDADSHFHARYLSALSVNYLRDPDRQFKIFQPAILFYSNLWRLPFPNRVYTAFQSIGHLARLGHKWKLVNQSTYSLSLQSCQAIGYWDTDVIPEDSHMFFKMFFRLGERVKVEPIFLPIMADAAEGRGFWASYRSLYEQEKRWSWGVSDVPFVLEGTLLAREIPRWRRIQRAVPFVWEHLLWPSNWFLLVLGTRLPETFAPRHLLPQMQPALNLTWFTLNISATFLVFLALVHVVLAASAPGLTLRSRLLTLLGWPFMPVITFFALTLPAMDAHLRLLVGRRLEYKVTEKMPPSPANATVEIR